MTSSSESPFAASADALAFPAPADLDDAYENRKYIPKADIHMQEWEQQSAAFRAAAPHAELDQPYGTGARQRYDLFWPAGGPGSEQGLLVIVHGGYWLAFSKDNFSHLASGALAAGWAVAMLSYTLAPAARISEITAE
ncbi:MAG: alpha/beta hydrolase, partial [Candidatus Puniceispirillaceae bacterium]